MKGKLSDAQWGEVIARFLAGEKVPDLCRAFGLRKSRIYRELKAAGASFNHGSEKGRPEPEAFDRLDLSDGVIRDLMGRVERSLFRYRDHCEFEDMLSEAYLAMWQALSCMRKSELRSEHLSGLACRAAWNGVGQWMMSPKSGCRRRNYEGRELPMVESLEHLLGQAQEGQVTMRRYPALAEPDFAPPLIERLWAAEIWREGLKELLFVERAVLTRWLLGGEDPALIGRDIGVSRERVYQIRQQALNRFRRRLGVREKNDGTYGCRKAAGL